MIDAAVMGNPVGGRTGGVYVPPFKLARAQAEQAAVDPSSPENQRLSWEALRKSLNGLINKVNVSNIKNIIPELFQENLIRGRGLLARGLMKAQLASPGFTHIYAALIAVLNTKLPENGELILKRVVYGFKRAYKRRDKITATALAKFIAHLVNHQVAHELLALQLLTVLLEEPTDDSVEIAVNFAKEVGQILQELSPQGLQAVFERFREILHEGDIDKRVQYTVENLFAVWKSGFQDYPAIPSELDLVERSDQITFEVGLTDEIDREEMLDIFRVDPQFKENEELWEQIKREILGDEDEEAEAESNRDEAEQYDEDNENEVSQALTTNTQQKTTDMTEQDLINLRRSIYLTIMSSVGFEECCHKLLKLNIPAGYESELCSMLVECCSNERSFLKYYGLMGQRFCMLHQKYQDCFDDVFRQQYETIHRLETNKLRNVAKFFGHLLATDALPWTCLEYIKVNEYDTTSSSRIFIKVLLQDLAEIQGLAVLIERFNDPYMEDIFSGMFPKDNARNTRFAINFYTSIGLGALTDGLRDHLKQMTAALNN
jgi:pre-mRNA-splicing factor CWC22